MSRSSRDISSEAVSYTHLDVYKRQIQDLARQTGCSEETLAASGQMNLARELWDIIPEELLEKFGKALIELCHQMCIRDSPGSGFR